MNRPPALIQGDLAFPNAWLLGGLPPPFGSRRPVRATVQREPQPVEPAATQRAMWGKPAQPVSVGHGSFPLGAKFVLFYKLPQQRDPSDRFDAQLAEARRYLEAGKARPRSSRSDHVLGAAIFLGCSIALAWLLSTCAARDAGSAATVATTRPAVHGAPQPQALGTLPKAERQGEPAQTPPRVEPRVAAPTPGNDTASGLPAQPARRIAVAHVTQAQAGERLASTHSVRSATRPTMPKHPERAADSSSADDSAELTALLAWAAQQRRANVTSRATVPVPGDVGWTARMTQRRITDNADAFQTGFSQP